MFALVTKHLTTASENAAVGRFHASRNWLGADSDAPSTRENVAPMPPANKLNVSAWPTTDERLDAGTTPVRLDKATTPRWVDDAHRRCSCFAFSALIRLGTIRKDTDIGDKLSRCVNASWGFQRGRRT